MSQNQRQVLCDARVTPNSAGPIRLVRIGEHDGELAGRACRPKLKAPSGLRVVGFPHACAFSPMSIGAMATERL